MYGISFKEVSLRLKNLFFFFLVYSYFSIFKVITIKEIEKKNILVQVGRICVIKILNQQQTPHSNTFICLCDEHLWLLGSRGRCSMEGLQVQRWCFVFPSYFSLLVLSFSFTVFPLSLLFLWLYRWLQKAIRKTKQLLWEEVKRLQR